MMIMQPKIQKIESKYEIKFVIEGTDILHRLDGPAVYKTEKVSNCFYEEYRAFGHLHREDDGPAITHWCGDLQYFRWGKHHRNNGPCYISDDKKAQAWAKMGEFDQILFPSGDRVVKCFDENLGIKIWNSITGSPNLNFSEKEGPQSPGSSFWTIKDMPEDRLDDEPEYFCPYIRILKSLNPREEIKIYFDGEVKTKSSHGR